MNVKKTRVKILDGTLRDGQHTISHQFTPQNIRNIAGRLDQAGIDIIEVAHGYGLGGSSFQYGFGACSDEEMFEAARSVIHRGKLCITCSPGTGTREDLKRVKDIGIDIVRVGSVITETDITQQHIEMCKEMGFEVYGIVAQAPPIPVKDTVRQLKLMQDYGADVITFCDSSGCMLPEDVHVRVDALVQELKVPIGFHAHNNLQHGVANSMAAIAAGAQMIDTCLKGFGAGAGNAPTELVVAVMKRMGYETEVDLVDILNIGDEEIVPLMPYPMELTSDCLMLGYTSVFSSFRMPAIEAAKRYGVNVCRIIEELARRKATEGQEDSCIEIAYSLSQQKEA